MHDDWQAVFAEQEKLSHAKVGTPEHIEREKSLALSAYMLIRYYKMRGHEEAVLDPLRLVNFKEFGKVYVKNKLDHDLINNKILHDRSLDEPFTFPASDIFTNKIAVTPHTLRASSARSSNGPSAKSCTGCSSYTPTRSASSSCTSPTLTSGRGSCTSSSAWPQPRPARRRR